MRTDKLNKVKSSFKIIKLCSRINLSFRNLFSTYFLLTIITSLFLFSSFTSFVNATASQGDLEYEEIFRIEQGSTKFYVTSLNTSETWKINVTAAYEGVFYIFLFQERPLEDFITPDFTIDPRIYETSVAYNNTPGLIYDSELEYNLSNVYMEYSFNESVAQLFYLEIILVENGPDSFKIQSSKELQPFFIPFIPGYPTRYIIVGFLTSSIGILVLVNRKKLGLNEPFLK